MSEQQHNDTPANAIATGINSQASARVTLAGTIGDNNFLADLRDDMDFYRFQGGAGDRIEWKIAADGYPWYLANSVFGGIVYDSNGNRLQNSTQSGVGTYAFILPANGPYYLAVWGALGRPFSGTFSDINPNLFPRSIGNAVRVGSYSLSLELFDNTPNYPSFTGTARSDTLKGTASADTLIGLAGDDTYIGLAEFRLRAFVTRQRRISQTASPSSGDHSFTQRS